MFLGAFVTALWGLSRPGNHKSKSKRIVNTLMFESKVPPNCNLGSLVSLVSVMSWSMNWPQTTNSTVTAWSWKPSS